MIKIRCQTCGSKVAPFPIKGQPEKTLSENYKEKTIIWKNLFKMDWLSLSFIIIILFLAWAYSQDTEACYELLEKPCQYAEARGCMEQVDMIQIGDDKWELNLNIG